MGSWPSFLPGAHSWGLLSDKRTLDEIFSSALGIGAWLGPKQLGVSIGFVTPSFLVSGCGMGGSDTRPGRLW